MADITPMFERRFRSKQHVGSAKPTAFARIRKGKFVHGYQDFTFLDGSTEEFAQFLVRGESSAKPWCAKWEPTTAWMTLPNVLSTSKDKSLDNNGIATMTVQVENVFYQAIAGVLGDYFQWRRGWFAPWRGVATTGRAHESWSQLNEWHDILAARAQIEIWHGYGDAQVKSFTGLLDDADLTSSPDHITLTLRDFGGPVLTEQRLFDRNKDPKLRVPITFADRRSAFDEEKVGMAPKASSQDPSRPASKLTDKHGHTVWESADQDSPNDTQWCEIHLARGAYEDFIMRARWTGMEAYVSVYVHDLQKADKHHKRKKARVDGVDVNVEGWHDAGLGNVPGTTIPYVAHIGSLKSGSHTQKLNAKYEMGDNSVLRVWLRDLHKMPNGKYRAGIEALYGWKRKAKKEPKANNWILVDDVADVVKVVLRWAGFREWEIESTGGRIDPKKPWVFHETDYLIDIINYVKSQGDFTFFMADPSADDLSIGVPTFRYNRALFDFDNQAVPEFRDTTLLTGVDLKISSPPKASLIRVRGAQTPPKGKRGQILGEDKTRMVQASYRPSWSRRDGQAGINLYETAYIRLLTTTLDCKVAAILIAFQMAMAGDVGQIQVPGYPAVDLDQRVSVVDEGTGITSRLYVNQLSEDFQAGGGGGDALFYTSVFSGSLIDTKDIQAIRNDYLAALDQKAAQEDLSPPVAIGGRPQPRGSGDIGTAVSASG